jgi:NAD-dependent DNA ligase
VATSALPGGLRDLASGEPVTDVLQHVRLCWARRTCAAHGGWPLHQLLAALLVGDFGPTTAADLARELGTWERFTEAIDQMREAILPASREELVLAHNALGRPVGLFEATPDALDHARGLYLEPLATMLDACGPRAWRSLQAWARSPGRASEVAELLAIATPLPFGPDDYDAFLRERFANPAGS